MSKAEIDELDNGQTGVGTAFIRGGGYNCRHVWEPVRKRWYSDSEWKSMRINQGGAKGHSQQGNAGKRRLKPSNAKRTRTGELTDGIYRVSPEKAARHAHDSAQKNKSRFNKDVDAEQIGLEAAQKADAEGAWDEHTATVDMGRLIGTDVYTNKPTRHVTVYKKKNGVIHATPDTPTDSVGGSND